MISNSLNIVVLTPKCLNTLPVNSLPAPQGQVRATKLKQHAQITCCDPKEIEVCNEYSIM